MKNTALAVLGAVLVVVGVVFTLQGLGTLGGSAMSGKTMWAVIGPIIAVVGLALAAVGVRGRRSVP
jgi:uncharacterized membrane protein YidH (DUF202 family)